MMTVHFVYPEPELQVNVADLYAQIQEIRAYAEHEKAGYLEVIGRHLEAIGRLTGKIRLLVLERDEAERVADAYRQANEGLRARLDGIDHAERVFGSIWQGLK